MRALFVTTSFESWRSQKRWRGRARECRWWSRPGLRWRRLPQHQRAAVHLEDAAALGGYAGVRASVAGSSSSSSSSSESPERLARRRSGESAGTVRRFYRYLGSDALAVQAAREALSQLLAELGHGGEALPAFSVEREDCYYVLVAAEAGAGTLSQGEEDILWWLLSETFEPERFSESIPFIPDALVEIGPRLNFQTAWCSNAMNIFRACGLQQVRRVERSRRYAVEFHSVAGVAEEPASSLATLVLAHREAFLQKFTARIHDRMTEQTYQRPLQSFETGIVPEPVYRVPLLRDGKAALQQLNQRMGLGLDAWDIDYYYNMFRGMNRDPTNVELFDIAQSNSEHSRHWLFRGRVVIDGEEQPHSLLDLVREPLRRNPTNSVLAFVDNSSSIRGPRPFRTLQPLFPDVPSEWAEHQADNDILMTAETHNFPSGVAPFPGAETGTGGRIRDTAATGTGSLVGVATAGYSVGNLRIPGYSLPWEDPSFQYPNHLESPLTICIQASNGASDYGNKFGEPVVQGFCRSFGLRLAVDGGGDRRVEYVKPIMFSGGLGQMDHRHAHKGAPQPGMCVVKVGGPAYRIGMGGGAASSMVQGDNRAELDFDAVQRGDAEMEQRAYRVIRACVEMGERNPIVSIHDQGAGGNCNVVKELIHPAGARIDVRQIIVGDETLSVLEIWGAEYQEQFGLLLRPESMPLFRQLCERENVPLAVLGQVDGSGKVVLFDSRSGEVVEELELERVLGQLPRKRFEDSRVHRPRPTALSLPMTTGASMITKSDHDLVSVLNRVLRLLSVGSKRFLTTKVDRSVTGLVARQQTVGPVQLPLADVAVAALSHVDEVGAATAIGEQCLKSLVWPAAMARMAVAEMLTNLAAARITRIEDIKCEANWMAAGKLSGELASMYEAAEALSAMMTTLGIAIDGGKDSVSMAARCPGEADTVRAPLTLVVSGYAPVLDVMRVLTPAIQRSGASEVLLLDPSDGRARLGASALAQVYGQVGDSCPDVESVGSLRAAFELVQQLIDEELALSYHDRSDGGLMVALLEMAFAGNCGLDMYVDPRRLDVLFSEEVGMLVEVPAEAAAAVMERAATTVVRDAGGVDRAHLSCRRVARTRRDKIIQFFQHERATAPALSMDMRDLRALWEETSFQLEALQANPICVAAEKKACYERHGLAYRVPFEVQRTPPHVLASPRAPRVAILREEGSNGDREMAAAFHLAGFRAVDVSMRDLSSGRVRLDDFRGVAFVGGFSFADVLDSAKGWAGVIRYRAEIAEQFERFRQRPDTFSLGVCNGCQLMALLGWVPGRFVRNESDRFESRFGLVRINAGTPAIMLRGMEEAVLGVWVSHGEGRAIFPLDDRPRVAPMQYADDSGEVVSVTDTSRGYPFCPNGSVDAIAAVCSADGRHLAMMPHPERTIHLFNWAYLPEEARQQWSVSPWLKMFQNAREWCEQTAEARDTQRDAAAA
ncbi:hypothetical protein CDCA_CDCA05G1538 [Cyanidium caldarium]|uniref:phosphoribosylformylglycinamidine synthase n=1 Tax=Cyanidium caldarium TaxID=2771 RepID=A0AAV9ITB5_CYACA|nr:hypothetical protein CDCA_CDCA05G1538 [Cyanidium caldarium]